MALIEHVVVNLNIKHKPTFLSFLSKKVMYSVHKIFHLQINGAVQTFSWFIIIITSIYFWFPFQSVPIKIQKKKSEVKLGCKILHQEEKFWTTEIVYLSIYL